MGRFGFDVSDDERNTIMRAIEVARVLNYDKMPKRYHGTALAIISQEWLDTIDDDVITEALGTGEIFEERFGNKAMSERRAYHYKHVIRGELFKTLNGMNDVDPEIVEGEPPDDQVVAFRQAIRVACNDAIQRGTGIKAFFADTIDDANRLAICAYSKIFLRIDYGNDVSCWVLISGNVDEIAKVNFGKALDQYGFAMDDITITELAVGDAEYTKKLETSQGVEYFAAQQKED